MCCASGGAPVESLYRERQGRSLARGGDHGPDLVAEGKGERVIMQCKRYRNWKVRELALRDLYGAMHDAGTAGLCGDDRAGDRRGQGVVAGQADRDLGRRLRGAAGAGTAPASGQTMGRGPAPEEACPRCGRALVMRRNRTTGEAFLGCEGFPRCRYARPMRG